MLPKNSESFEKPVQRPRWFSVFLFAVVIALTVVGVKFYNFQKVHLRDHVSEELGAIARLKSGQIERWRERRLADAQLLIDAPAIVSEARTLLDDPNSTPPDAFVSMLVSMKTQFEYDDILLINAKGDIRWSIDERDDPIVAPHIQYLKPRLDSETPFLSDLYLGADGSTPLIDSVIPLTTPGIDHPVAFGAILLRSDARKLLYPLIQSWPISSESGESLLVRRDNDAVLFLNELRHKKGTAFRLRIPLSRLDLPAAQAVQGFEGMFEGRDYRNIPVVSFTRAIPDSPWFLIVKMDTQEAFAAWRFRAKLTLAFFIGLIVALIALMSMIWQRQDKRYFQWLLNERRKAAVAEKRYELLARKSRDIILFIDRNTGHILEANAAAVDLYGYSRSEFLEKSITDLRAPGTIDSMAAQMELADNEGMFFETVHRRSDGTEFPVEVSSQGTTVGESRLLISIIRDITDRKKAEAKLRKFNETLERRVAERTSEVIQQAEQLRALASQLSRTEQRERQRLAKILHDHIQQLIVASQMQLRWLKHNAHSEKFPEAVERIESILGEALQASRSLTIDLSPPVLQHGDLIGALEWLCSRLRDNHQFHVEFLAESRAESVSEDVRYLLYESARELLFNAVKHSGVAEAQMTLFQSDRDHLTLAIADRGQGFDPEEIKSRTADQMSFGLFSIQERLAYINGRMVVETTPNHGAKIMLTVPLQQANTATPEQKQDNDARDTMQVYSKSACRVLLVDDHKIVREGLAGLLRFEPNIEIVGEASSGAEALVLSERLAPNVIIMDVNLGDMDGIEATRRIIEQHPQVHVIGLSMHQEATVAQAMRDAGAIAFLTKGGPSEELVNAIRSCHNGCNEAV